MRRDLRLLKRGATGAAARLALGSVVFVCGTLTAWLVPACGEGDTPTGSLCEPLQKIFCRCPGGDPGEKTCNSNGDAFGACEGCDPRPDVEGSGGGAGVGGGVPNPDALPFLRPCTDDVDCQSDVCEFGYCTHPCAKVSDCEYPISECVSHGGVTVCMPACKTAVDCEVYGAPPSMCGYAPAIDNWGVTVCSNWGADHELAPVDSDCAPLDHEQCNLGYPHRERVCTPEGVCKAGCFSVSDCPNGEKCDSDGATLGSCG